MGIFSSTAQGAVIVGSGKIFPLGLLISNTTTTISIAWTELWIENIKSLSRSFTINSATSGLLGLDTGSFTATTWYYIWAIAKDDRTVSVLVSTSSINPTLPTGYVRKRCISMVYCTSIGPIVFRLFTQNNDNLLYVSDILFFTANTTANIAGRGEFLAVDISATVPLLTNEIYVAYYTSSTSSANQLLNSYIGGYINGNKIVPVIKATCVGIANILAYAVGNGTLYTDNRQLYWLAQSNQTTSSSNTGIYCTGFKIPLGKTL